MSRQPNFLVGHMISQIKGCKLPSNSDCLRALLYNMRIVQLDFDYSSALVADEISFFGKKQEYLQNIIMFGNL